MAIGTYEQWLNQVRDALESIKMRMDDWQRIQPFDFRADYKAGTGAEHAAKKANKFWWREYSKSKVACPKCRAKVRMARLTKHLKEYHPLSQGKKQNRSDKWKGKLKSTSHS